MEKDLIKKITMKEALTVLKMTESEKTPGSDGLPHEFYLKTWRIFG